MTELEWFLTCLSEECDEVGQRAAKALRFGIREVQPGQDLSNATRIRLEMLDLLTVCSILRSRYGVELFNFASNSDMRHMLEKEKKLNEMLAYAKSLGVITE